MCGSKAKVPALARAVDLAQIHPSHPHTRQVKDAVE
jgi:hypothetical protein